MEKEFVEFKQSLELQNLGYNTAWRNSYWIVSPLLKNKPICSQADEESIADGTYRKNKEKLIIAPLYQQVFRWFRDKGFGINIYSKDNENKEWYFLIKKGTITTNDVVYKTYEKAELACLKKIIEIVKEK